MQTNRLNGDSSRKLISAILMFSMMFCIVFSSATPIYAASGKVVNNAYSTSIPKVKEAFSQAFGWDSSKIDAITWTGVDGETHARESFGYQVEYYKDILDLLCEELGITLTDDNSDGGTFTSGGAGGSSIAAVALAEVGNCESPLGSNNCKYTEWYGMPGEPWCAMFVTWCADQCGLLDSGLFTRTAWCDDHFNYLTGVDGFASYSASQITQFGGNDYTACVGDIYFFKSSNAGSGNFGHIGIVTNVTDTSIEITEGNGTIRGPQDCVGTDVFSIGDISASFAASNGAIVHVEYPYSGSNGGSGYSQVCGDASSVIEAVTYFCQNSLGLNRAAIAGILANMAAESNLVADCYQIGGPAYGLCQWDDRKNNLFNYCAYNGLDVTSVEGQLLFLQYELNTTESATYQMLLGIPDTAQGAQLAGYKFCKLFERCANVEYQASVRGSNALSFY